jgi:hypothetical protein
VRSDADVKALVDAALATYDGLDYAFNNDQWPFAAD